MKCLVMLRKFGLGGWLPFWVFVLRRWWCKVEVIVHGLIIIRIASRRRLLGIWSGVGWSGQLLNFMVDGVDVTRHSAGVSWLEVFGQPGYGHEMRRTVPSKTVGARGMVGGLSL